MKKVLLFIFLSLMFIGACNRSPEDTGLGQKRAGLTLDIARKFYDVETIKRFINTLADMDAQYLHLHLSDDQNYALESTILGQTKANATFIDGIYINNKNHRKFLSVEQIRDLVAYARSKNIEIIPEIDAPAHSKGIADLLRQKDLALAQKIFKDNQLTYTKPEAVNFIRSLYQEVIEIIGQGNIRRFHIGMDEFAFGGTQWSHEVVQYANNMHQWLKNKGLIMQVWNDAVLKKDLHQWSKEIEICYWSYDGDTNNTQIRNENLTHRTTLPELASAGFRVYNFNSYYLYSIPVSNPSQMERDAYYAGLDLLKNWDLGLWDKRQASSKIIPEKIAGAGMAIWGESSGNATGEQIRAGTELHLRAMILKTKATTDERAKNLVSEYTANNGAKFQEIKNLKLR